MLINKYTQYNPKIDYLICKSLINYLPKTYDEYRLRNVYCEKENAVENYEKDILKIKKFFYENDAFNLNEYKIKKLLRIILKKEINIKDYYLAINKKFNNDYLFDLVQNTIQYKGNIRSSLIKIGILLSSLKSSEVPMIPLRNVVRKITSSNENSYEFIQKMYYRLITKRNKYSLKHDILENKIAIRTLKEKVDEIGKIFQCEKIGIYGSFATQEENEYSDLDVLIVISSNRDKEKIKKEMALYFKKNISIPVDIKVVNLSTLDDELTLGMKKSLNIIWEN